MGSIRATGQSRRVCSTTPAASRGPPFQPPLLRPLPSSIPASTPVSTMWTTCVSSRTNIGYTGSTRASFQIRGLPTSIPTCNMIPKATRVCCIHTMGIATVDICIIPTARQATAVATMEPVSLFPLWTRCRLESYHRKCLHASALSPSSLPPFAACPDLSCLFSHVCPGLASCPRPLEPFTPLLLFSHFCPGHAFCPRLLKSFTHACAHA